MCHFATVHRPFFHFACQLYWTVLNWTWPTGIYFITYIFYYIFDFDYSSSSHISVENKKRKLSQFQLLRVILKHSLLARMLCRSITNAYIEQSISFTWMILSFYSGTNKKHPHAHTMQYMMFRFRLEFLTRKFYRLLICAPRSFRLWPFVSTLASLHSTEPTLIYYTVYPLKIRKLPVGGPW